MKNKIYLWDINNYCIRICSKEFVFPDTFLDVVKVHKWHIDSNGYAIAHIGSSEVRLHELLMGKKRNHLIDHINGDKTNNQFSNLRFVTHQHNIWNNKCRGYCWIPDRRKWRAYIKVDYKQITLGEYKKESDAKQARKNAEEHYFGEYRNKYKYMVK